jgi:hypothetical protein
MWGREGKISNLNNLTKNIRAENGQSLHELKLLSSLYSCLLCCVYLVHECRVYYVSTPLAIVNDSWVSFYLSFSLSHRIVSHRIVCSHRTHPSDTKILVFFFIFPILMSIYEYLSVFHWDDGKCNSYVVCAVILDKFVHMMVFFSEIER